MTASASISVFHGLVRIGVLITACAAAASLAMAAIRAIPALFAGSPIGFDLLQPPVERDDLLGAALILALLVLELLRNGWRNSALCRLLTRDDASTRTDLVYGAISTTGVMMLLSITLTLGLTRGIDALGDGGTGLRLCADLLLWLAVPGILFVHSFGAYWVHRLMHTRWFWHLHAVHHAAEDFNVVTVLRQHPVELAFNGLPLPVLPALLGFSGEAMMIAVVVTYAYFPYVHSELPSSRFAERWIAFGPRGHGIHHSTDASCFNTNFGDLVIWDRLFGTYKTGVSAPVRYGCADPDGIYQSGRPWRDMVAVQAAWLRGLWDALPRVQSVPIRSWFAGLAMCLVAAPAALAAEPLRRIEVVGTQFRVTTASGGVLPQEALIGAVLSYADGKGVRIPVRVDRIIPDPKNPNGGILLYGFSMQDTDGAWHDMCDPDPDGVRAGFPIALGTGRGFTLTCTSGAQGKCVRFGYKPWANGPNGEALLPYWQACTRMVRADYCGDGNPHTRNGTLIDFYDAIGIQQDEPGPDMEFEAAWGTEGAICVRRVRIPELYSLEALRAECPRLLPANLGETCTEERMSKFPGVLLMNKSGARLPTR